MVLLHAALEMKKKKLGLLGLKYESECWMAFIALYNSLMAVKLIFCRVQCGLEEQGFKLTGTGWF